MRNFIRRRLCLLTLLAATALTTPARATVVWTATLEKGDLSEWGSGPNPTKTLPDGTVRKNVEVVGEQVYGGKFACKITVHPDDTFGQYNQDRVDIKHDSTLTGEGKDSYLSGYYYLPEDAKTRNEIAFYETKGTSRNWMDLWVEPKTGGGTTVKFGIESNGAILGSVLVWTGDWTAKRWHQFAIHVHWSTDPQQGLVDLWFDGQQVVTGYKHKTKFDGNDMFYETGLHRVLPKAFVETIYFDDFIEADTLAEIKIAVPMEGGGSDGGTTTPGSGGTGGGVGGSGGTTDAAGGAGAGGGGGAIGAAGNAGAGGGQGGSAGTGGTAGTGASGSAGTSGAAGAGGYPPSASGACGCATTGTTSARVLGAFGLLALAAMRVRRRRRHHPRDDC
jgi:MYXO-CTERM domain-containing protein